MLLSADIVLSYYLDRFSTTHYIDIVGDNGSGKSTMGETFATLGYRVVNITDPTAPNYFRVLGSLQPVQCSIVADEAESIDKSPELMGILKAGYNITGRVSRINPFTNKSEYFFAYCLKVIIAEKSRDLWKARGVMDRTFVLHCYRGQLQYDIKEILVPAGHKRRQRLLEELLHLLKLLLVYRLLHFDDPMVDLDIGVQGRNKELCKPLLQLYHGSQTQLDVIVALQRLLDEKNERRQNTLESALYPIVSGLTKEKDNEVPVMTLWSEIISGIPGTYDDKKRYQYETREFGTLHYNTITKIMVDKFGAKSKRKSDGAVLVFDKEKLQRFARSYTESYDSDRIRVNPIQDDDTEGDEGSNVTADASWMKSHENGAADPVYENAIHEKPDKDNSDVPCAYCDLSFPDEKEVIGHMTTIHLQWAIRT